MNGGQPDRIPIWCLLSLQHIVQHGTTEGQIPSTIEQLIRAECELTNKYNFDGHLVYFPAIKKDQKVSELLDKMIFGVPKGEPDHNFETADPDSWSLNIPEFTPEDFYSSRFTREILGEAYHLGGWIADGYSRALQWFPSLEEASMALLTDPVRFNSLVNHFNEISIAEVVAQIQLGGIESVQISSPYAGSSFISTESYKDFVLDSITKLASAISEAGAKSYIHTCGFISDRLELLVKTGTNGIECMDPPPLGNVTLSEAKKRVGNQIFLKGNIDSVNVLLQGSDEYFEKTIKETIEVGKVGGGYILSTACSVAPDVHPDRMIRLKDLVDKFGIYD
jgi:hypothetical protein